ncbi:UDP-N-acetylglucosamine 1-carboxyvinyltransferase [[Leptolyngbya] sp. PCC 7376]|uniref:UDP-N-acetylglucosamine 1-carboxyvinyltransferase n=1 Tax=[Leptolyngbya] sp. PCC 7376 TaxID=111781 RepID=UPI00029F4CE6|nr:UDP-N-acetylglucosamine 1-carboxyvinyltransferase [[Leptolyngbya] sp. PCC 7376]AFY39378.1 UDP-N-acetylglucosamine 1-carboxyvinyltransferase [[Leptolyngbya] sp. PCC 7376]
MVEDRPINISAPVNAQTEAPEKSETVLKIEGGHSLSGEVRISGAKNSALAIMAGTILCSDECRLTNIPDLADIKRMSEVIRALGVGITASPGTLDFDARHLSTSEAPYDLVSKLRASFFIIGPLLARMGEAQVPLPGGCAIGARPVDLHVRGLRAMGAEVIIEHGVVHATVKGSRRKLKGAKIYLDYPSVGATETLMMAATLAEGQTIIENAAQEPEVVDLADFCRSMGATIIGDGSNKIVIQGCDRLHSTDYPIIPDRIEAGTFLVAGAITQSAFSIFPVIPAHLLPVIAKLKETGTNVIEEAPNRLRLQPQGLRATDIETLPYPGFPTDMQAQFMALLTLCEGSSVVTETVFENRMHHVAELSRMGAAIKIKGNNAIISGVPFLSGAPVMATDLRASAALVLAGLAAEGTTTMHGIHHMDRGYDDLEGKFKALGAKIERLTAIETE